MLNLVLYSTASLIWGSTWLAIKLQLTQVPPILSVGYRFCLASAILLTYCLLTKKKLAYPSRDHLFMALQGFTLYGLSYCLSYLATSYLTSGLVAVVFSTILMWNILNLRLFMDQPVAWRAFWGGALGLSGICIVFWHELYAFTATQGLIGLVMALVGAYLASVGNIVGARNARTGLAVTQANAYGMAYGGVLSLLIHFGGGGRLAFDWSLGYLGPMLYLTVFGSVVAFGCYMLLIGRIGAEYAAYVTLLMPVIALIFSTLFEDYRWTLNAGLGVSIVLVGNLIILTPRETLLGAYYRIKGIGAQA
ncbi:MAG: EamA family transporter [Deltaproteobacteria bacterium]|nr:EamA family transporter [Deltaproteobacteria bacterium]MBW2066935.1 EamA family transporter [Deltaproteobacteria bacterium]